MTTPLPALPKSDAFDAFRKSFVVYYTKKAWELLVEKDLKDFNTVVGQRIKTALQIAKIKQSEVANALGITNQTMSSYVNGKSQVPPYVLAEIARMCNVSADYLLGLKDEIVPLFENDRLSTELEDIGDSYSKLSVKQRKQILELLISCCLF